MAQGYILMNNELLAELLYRIDPRELKEQLLLPESYTVEGFQQSVDDYLNHRTRVLVSSPDIELEGTEVVPIHRAESHVPHSVTGYGGRSQLPVLDHIEFREPVKF